MSKRTAPEDFKADFDERMEEVRRRAAEVGVRVAAQARRTAAAAPTAAPPPPSSSSSVVAPSRPIAPMRAKRATHATSTEVTSSGFMPVLLQKSAVLIAAEEALAKKRKEEAKEKAEEKEKEETEVFAKLFKELEVECPEEAEAEEEKLKLENELAQAIEALGEASLD